MPAEATRSRHDVSAAFWPVTIALAVLARIAAAAMLGSMVTNGDPARYVELANALLSGHGLVVADPVYGPALRTQYPPVYPLLLAGVGALLGVNVVAITILNTLLDLLAARLILAIGGAARQPWARLAAAIYLLWPSFVLSAPVAQKESLLGLLTLAVFAVFARTADGTKRSWREGVALGLLTAAVALTQPALLLLPAGLALALLRRVGIAPLARLAAVALPVAGIAMAPWWLRNWLLYERFVPLTTTTGASLRLVINGRHLPPGAAELAMIEPDRSAAMAEQAWAGIRTHPVRYVLGTARRLLRALTIEQFAFRRIGLSPGHPARLAAQATEWGMIAAAAWGAVRRPNRLLLALLAGGAVTLLGCIWFEFAERHRYFLMPLLFLIAAPVLAGAVARVRRRG